MAVDFTPTARWRTGPAKLIGGVPAATSILDRFLDNADVIAITGRSYRLKDRAATKAEHADTKKQACEKTTE